MANRRGLHWCGVVVSAPIKRRLELNWERILYCSNELESIYGSPFSVDFSEHHSNSRGHGALQTYASKQWLHFKLGKNHGIFHHSKYDIPSWKIPSWNIPLRKRNIPSQHNTILHHGIFRHGIFHQEIFHHSKLQYSVMKYSIKEYMQNWTKQLI